MKSVKSLTRIYFLTTLALALLGATLRTIAMLLCFDAEVGYFQVGILPTLCNILSVVAVIAPVVLSIISPKGTYPDKWSTQPSGMIALIPAITLLASSVFTIVTQLIATSSSTLSMALGILGILAGLYFLLTMHPSITNKHPQATSLLGFAVVFWALACLAETYFDLFTTMNSPVKLILQFSLLSVALATISELRFRLGKSLPRMAVALHSIAIYFSLTSGVSTLVAYLANSDSLPLRHALYAIPLLGLGVYLAIRLFVYMLKTPDTPQPSTQASEEVES